MKSTDEARTWIHDTFGHDSPEAELYGETLEMFNGDPMPLEQNGLPPFPDDALPAPYAEMTRATATALQVDTAMVGPMVLGALSAACGGCVEAQPRGGWTESGVLHILVSAEPGERKSPVQATITRPLHAAEKMLMDAAAASRAELCARRDIAERKAKEAARIAAKLGPEEQALALDPEQHAVDLAKAAEAIVVPGLPRVLADDVTPEALASAMAENRGRIAVMSSEGGVFATLAGRYTNNVANLDVWLKGYSGDPVRVDRKGRNAEVIDRPALTVCLAAQPDVLTRVCGNTEFHGRGLLARFSYAIPKSMVGRRDPEAAEVPPSIAMAYTTELTGLTIGLHEREGDPTLVTFDARAEYAIVDLMRRVEARLVGGRDLSGNMREWGSKYVGTVVRIALLLHMAEHGAGGADRSIAETTVSRAERIGEFFAAHTRAAFGITATGNVKVSDLRAVLEYLRRSQPKPYVSPCEPIEVRTITKSGPDVLRRASTAGPVLDMLADLNVIVRLREGRKHYVILHPHLYLPPRSAA